MVECTRNFPSASKVEGTSQTMNISFIILNKKQNKKKNKIYFAEPF